MLSLVSTLVRVQERTRSKLTQQGGWFHELAENLPQMVWASDATGFKVFCSNNYLSYTGADSVLTMNSTWVNFVHPDDQAMAMKRWLRSLESAEPYQIEYRLRRCDGQYRYVEAAALPFRNRRGKIAGWLGVSNDIHEQKLSEQARQRATNLTCVQRLAASMAHEINNPLEGMTNSLYLALHGEDLNATRAYLKIAERELQRVTHVTSHALRFHRQASAKIIVSARRIVSDVLFVYRARIEAAGITLDVAHRGDTPLSCYERDLCQALGNLVRNAVDAMPTGGSLLIRTGAAYNWRRGEFGLVLTVADTGSGIPARLLARLFEPFNSTKGDTRVGLGLWVVEEVLKRHGGTIRFRSRTGTIGHGTVARLFIPLRSMK